MERGEEEEEVVRPDAISADDFLPLFTYALVQAGLPQLLLVKELMVALVKDEDSFGECGKNRGYPREEDDKWRVGARRVCYRGAELLSVSLHAPKRTGTPRPIGPHPISPYPITLLRIFDLCLYRLLHGYSGSLYSAHQ